MVKKSIVYVIIKGRTGNQLFQYSFARAIQSYLESSELVLDFSEIGGNTSLIDMFSVVDYTAIVNDLGRRSLPFSLKLKILLYRLLRKVNIIIGWEKAHVLETRLSPLLQCLGIYYQFGTNSFLNYRKPSPKTRFILVRGWFESEQYFEPVKTFIKSELVLKKECPIDLVDIYERLKNGSSICISIRRGDFASSEYCDEYLICTIDYYKVALEIILQSHPDSIVFICSDDIQWCKDNFIINSGPEIHFEPLGLSIEDKIRLMSACSHFVLSNSTFSWWVAYLSSNKDKMIVAPSIWRRVTPRIIDIYNKDWLLVNSDNLNDSK